jgi:hypothetical protein
MLAKQVSKSGGRKQNKKHKKVHFKLDEFWGQATLGKASKILEGVL